MSTGGGGGGTSAGGGGAAASGGGSATGGSSGTGGGAATGGGVSAGGGTSAGGGAATGGGSAAGGGSAGDGTLASKYPCDNGIATDSAVVWAENFEEGSVSAVTTRYDAHQNDPGMALTTDKPAKSCGAKSLSLTSGAGTNATDLYKQLPDHDELYVRWYAKYQAGVPWHHSGFWFGGYNPATSYPNPQAGIKPNGDDRVSFSIEPIWDVGMSNPRLDFYNYWMNMHTCSSCGGSYWGNALIARESFTADNDTWMCLEVHANLATQTLEVWKNDVLVQSFPETGTPGFWVQDHFCPTGADGPECNYSPTAQGPLDLQFRTTSALKLNHIWPQNYITDSSTGTLQFDDIVVATSRIGCIR
jgi:hypothetical protein